MLSSDIPSSDGRKIAYKHSEAIPSPFLDYSNLFLPTNIREAFEIAELMYYTNRTFAQAMEYVVAYFTGTDLNLTTTDEDKAGDYKKYLLEKLHIKNHLYCIGRDLKVYGNSAISVLAPFQRFLVCPECHSAHPIVEVDYKFSMVNGFEFQCPSDKCRKHVKVDLPEDRVTKEENRVVIKRWPIKYIHIEYQPYGNETEYYYRVPPIEANAIRAGQRKYLEEAPLGIIQAVRKDKLFKFNSGMLLHLSLENLSDIMMGPYGLPPIIAGFRDAYNTQLLRKANSTMALDHMLPVRLVTPATTAAGGQDPMRGVNSSGFGQQVMNSIRRARQDNTGWQWLPVPVNYQLLGGEGQQMISPELLDATQSEFLNGLGVPVEMYRKNLSMESAPFAARLFEAGEAVFLSKLHAALAWIVDRISAVLSWLPCETTLARPTHADDIERRMIMLQMMIQGIAAEQDVLSLFDLNWKDTFKKRQAEQEFKMREEKKFMERMDKAEANEQVMSAPGGAQIAAPGQQAPGALGPGGGVSDPTGGGGGGGGPQPPPMPVNGIGGAVAGAKDLESVVADAQSRVAQIMQTAPLGSPQRRQALAQIKASDPNLYAIVKSMLDEQTAAAADQGKQQLRGGPQ